MPMNYSLVIEPFDVWGFDYMGPFPSSNGYTHIDRKGAENPVADNLSRLENVLDDPLPIDDSFLDE